MLLEQSSCTCHSCVSTPVGVQGCRQPSCAVCEQGRTAAECKVIITGVGVVGVGVGAVEVGVNVAGVAGIGRIGVDGVGVVAGGVDVSVVSVVGRCWCRYW